MSDTAETPPGRGTHPLAYIIPLLAGLIDLPYGLAIRLLASLRGATIPKCADSPRRRKRGLTIVLGGIEGPSFYNAQIVRGLLASGYRGAVLRMDWNDGIPFVRSAINLMSPRHHELHARNVVDIVTTHQIEHPCAPVNIVSQSGGCWIAVRAVEMLPESTRVSTVVLHAPAISPGYALGHASERCTHAMISVEACGDYVMLGVGTLVFGTSDRLHCLSGGLVGFHDRARKLIPMRWRSSWLRYGHIGNHTTSASFAFVRDIIGPFLLTRRSGSRKDSRC